MAESEVWWHWGWLFTVLSVRGEANYWKGYTDENHRDKSPESTGNTQDKIKGASKSEIETKSKKEKCMFFAFITNLVK